MNNKQEVRKEGILDWITTIPFDLGLFLMLVVGDILQRLFFWSDFAQNIIYRYLNISIFQLLKICGVKYLIENDVDLTSRDSVIVISNHQSLMDIPLLCSALPKLKLKFIAKKELDRKIPYVSYCLRNFGHALINRDDKLTALDSISEFAQRAKGNFSMTLFPEGTRARRGIVNFFKPGGFESLVNSLEEAHVVPVAIDGSWMVAKNKMLPIPFGATIRMKTFEPIVVRKGDDYEGIMLEIEEAIKQQIISWRESGE